MDKLVGGGREGRGGEGGGSEDTGSNIWERTVEFKAHCTRGSYMYLGL